MSGGAEPLHLLPRRTRAAPLPASEKIDCFTWTPEAQEALDGLKALLTKAPILVPLTEGEPLLLYVAATTQAVSTAVIVERQEEGHDLKV
jgi:hypothetical protein